MPTILKIPFTPEECKEDEEYVLNIAVNKNQESTKPITISLVFHGIPISTETEVVAQVDQPVFSLVKDLRCEIANFAKTATNNAELSAATIKLNFVGVTLLDEKERISHVVKRILKDRHLKNPSLLKIFVSMDHNSRLAQQQHQNDFPHQAPTGLNAALRREREGGSASSGGQPGSGNGEPNMSVEQADAMANMFASNPQMIDMILNSDPTMREMMRTNPELARQMRDPDTLRSIFRGQASRQGRVMQDNEQRAALAFIQNHPEGNALIERALGQEGILNENGENSMFGISGRGGGNSLADEEAAASGSDRRGPLLPPTNNNTTNANPMAALFGGGGGGGGGVNPMMMMTPSLNTNNNPTNPFLSMMMGQQQPSNTDAAPTTSTINQTSSSSSINDLVKTLTEDMGFEKEIAELAATEAKGDLEKALALLEEWQN